MVNFNTNQLQAQQMSVYKQLQVDKLTIKNTKSNNKINNFKFKRGHRPPDRIVKPWIETF